jgi:prepilin-type N-terminal cleavage/methylation domain-containing protein
MSRDRRERWKLRGERGVTLIELLVVVTLVALLAAISFPSVASGLDSLRLRSTSNSMVAFFDTALDRSERRQQAIEIRILPKENELIARSADEGFSRRLDLPEGMHIASVTPRVEGNPDDPRRFLVYPGGSVPKVGIEIENKSGRKRLVSLDPITGVARAELEGQ